MFSFLSKKFGQVLDFLKGIEEINEDTLKKISESIKNVLLDADVPLVVIDKFNYALRTRCIGVKISKSIQAREYISKQFYDVLVEFLGGIHHSKKDMISSNFFNRKNRNMPFVIMLSGLQGAGKTTTVGKIINHITKKSVNLCRADEIVVSSLDYVRPASRKQLEIVVCQSGASYFDTTSIENIYDGAVASLNEAKNNKKKILIIDTAGRVTFDETMMNELFELNKISQPNLSFFVVDSMTGQNGIEIAKKFTEKIKYEGVILTKMDSDSPGGIAIGLSTILNIPILYSTYGEKKENFDLFSPERIARRILGLGDFLSLAEMASEKISKNEDDLIVQAVKKGHLSFDDYLKILSFVKKLGPMKNIVAMMPKGSGAEKVDDSQINFLERHNVITFYLRDSMTKKERKAPEIVVETPSRLKRISNGSGISENEVNKTISYYLTARDRFKEIKKFIKL
jgi:signal recognition particle subunit SRP54